MLKESSYRKFTAKKILGKIVKEGEKKLGPYKQFIKKEVGE
jgi:hypothetical protein